jgi:hypothetical protein
VSGNLEALGLDVEGESQGASDFVALPAGIYTAVITDSQLKPNKNGQGSHLSLTCQVIDGEYEGRLVWGNLTVQNANADAERIGRAQLAALCKAVGVLNPKDSTELHDKPVKIKVALRKDDPTRNDIKGFTDANAKDAPSVESVPEPEPAKPAPRAAAPRPSAPAPAAGKKPWQK